MLPHRGRSVRSPKAISTQKPDWAVSVCSSAESFCAHPEWTGAAAIAMFFIFLAIDGMEE